MVGSELAGSQTTSASGVRFHRCCSIAHGVAHTEGDIKEREVRGRENKDHSGVENRWI
jgi:hypothetical protein